MDKSYITAIVISVCYLLTFNHKNPHGNHLLCCVWLVGFWKANWVKSCSHTFLTLSVDAYSGCGLQNQGRHFLFLVRDYTSA